MTSTMGHNQTLVRDNNIKLVLKTLLENDLSCSDLAKRLGLSKPALTKITTQMENLGLITESGLSDDNTTRQLGRKKTYLTINENIGIVASVDFSTVNIKIKLCNLKGQTVLSKELIDLEFITEDTLKQISTTLKEMLASKQANNREFLCLCLGASGKIHKDTGEIVNSKKFFQVKDINVKDYFENQFNVSVLIKNDADLLLSAEKMFGHLKDSNANAILLYIDSGIGGAIMLDNITIDGANGYAGEFGLINIIENGKKAKSGDVISVNAIKEKIKTHQRKSGEIIFSNKFRWKHVVEKYHMGNKSIIEIIETTAIQLADLIVNIAEILDIDNVIIAGRIKDLGQSYIEKVNKGLFDNGKHIKAVYSQRGNEGVLEAGIYFATIKSFDLLIERRL